MILLEFGVLLTVMKLIEKEVKELYFLRFLTVRNFFISVRLFLFSIFGRKLADWYFRPVVTLFVAVSPSASNLTFELSAEFDFRCTRDALNSPLFVIVLIGP